MFKYCVQEGKIMYSNVAIKDIVDVFFGIDLATEIYL